MENNVDRNEKEIDLLELLFHVFKGWRKIIAVALIFTMLCGGYRYISLEQSIHDTQAIAIQKAAYQTALTTYDTTKASLEKEIENLTVSLDKQNDYNDNSILMHIDPFDEKVAYTSLYVDTDYQINPALTYQNVDISRMAIRSYIFIAQNGDMYNYIIDHLSQDIELRYLKEILTFGAEYDTNMMYIQVIHSDSELSKEILGLARECFDLAYDKISENVGAHKLKVIDESSQTIVDFGLETTQKSNLQLVATYETSITEKQNAINALLIPTEVVISNSTVIKSALKYAILGFILGLFLVIIVLSITYLMSDLVFNTKNIRTLYQLRVLGIYEKKTKKRIFGFLDRWIDRLEGTSKIKMEKDEIIKIISANLAAVLEIEKINDGNIMITGTADISDINDICVNVSEKLMNISCTFVSASNISYSANTIAQMRECNAVVIVENIEHSTFKEITKQLEYIHNLEKKVIGAILIK